jgi:hypothetical protein
LLFARSTFVFSHNIDLCFFAQVDLRVSLIRSETGLPRFFNCVLLPHVPEAKEGDAHVLLGGVA